jgi:sulfite reductase alpha subunit-like flavoprotein
MSLLKPRLYSVSSSPKEEPNRVQLTLGVRKAGWKSGMGICSEWLNTIEINQLVPVSLRTY